MFCVPVVSDVIFSVLNTGMLCDIYKFHLLVPCTCIRKYTYPVHDSHFTRKLEHERTTPK